jgi:formylglycine-generating enzyme required for sulfatase activity
MLKVEPALPPMVDVPGGTFVMGDDLGLPDQRPAHRVTVCAFAMARFAVTRAEYQVFCRETGTAPPASWDSVRFAAPRQPAVGVNWFEAMAYASWLASLTGRPFTLPTEAERERAARGLLGSRRFPWGDEPAPDGRPVRALEAPTVVDESLPNALGLFGLADGVHEWCLDWYAPEYYAVSPELDPRGPEAGTRRASRGGSWRHQVSTTPCAARSSLPPGLRYTDYGFRLVEK